MTKQEFTKRISKRLGLGMADVTPIVDEVFTELERCMIDGEEVAIRGFGLFFLKRRNPKMVKSVLHSHAMARQRPGFFYPSFLPYPPFMQKTFDKTPKQERKYSGSTSKSTLWLK